MSDTWNPEDEMLPDRKHGNQDAILLDRLALMVDGFERCPDHGWWNPRTWHECPVCFEAHKERNLSDPSEQRR